MRWPVRITSSIFCEYRRMSKVEAAEDNFLLSLSRKCTEVRNTLRGCIHGEGSQFLQIRLRPWNAMQDGSYIIMTMHASI